MAEVRYVLHPGHIHSARDSDVHYVGVAQLRFLHCVPPHAHVVVRPPHTDKLARFIFDATYRARPDDIHCYPQYNHTDYPAFKEDTHGS